MFNPWRTFRTASCVVLFIATYLHNWALVTLGFILLMTGLVGGLDLAERRIELLEKVKLLGTEDSNEKTETPEDH